jgi:hypothetical protein
VRRYAKASFAGSTQSSGMRRSRIGLACLCVLGLAAFLGGSAPSAGAQACPNEAFRNGPSANLPDCRAYEMVSPPDKGGTEVNYQINSGPGFAPTADPNGNSVVFSTISGTFAGASNGVGNGYLSRRGGTAWSTEGVSGPLPAEPFLSIFYVYGFTADLGQMVVQSGQEPLSPEASAGTKNLYLRDIAAGSYRWLSIGLPAGLGPSASPFPELEGMSADASHVVFKESDFELTGCGGSPNEELCDWNAATGTLSRVGVLPGGGVSTGQVSMAGDRLTRAVSADGSRIFFHEGGGGECGVCVRINGTSTQLVSETGTFQVASSDGSAAYVLESGELKRYDVVSDVLGPAIAGEVQGVLGASSDGSRVYLVSKEALAPGATGGENNLYLWTLGGGFDFIATGNTSSSFTKNWSFNTNSHSSRVTPDGMHLAFTASNSLTGYPDEGNSEVYLYSAATGALVCASCNPNGEPATSGAFVEGGGMDYQLLSRNLSDDGGRVFFNTEEALVPQDSNSAPDIYEYDAATGAVALISPGTGANSAVGARGGFEASASGNDVFFLTREQLVPTDKDEVTDVYDARVGGGLASQYPPPPAPPCTGKGCRGESSSPDLAAPAAAGFVGKGNVSQRQNCSKLGREAKKLSNRAKKLRRHAKQAKRNGKSKVAKKRNRKATRLAKRARNKSKSAKRCRKANRRASK